MNPQYKKEKKGGWRKRHRVAGREGCRRKRRERMEEEVRGDGGIQKEQEREETEKGGIFCSVQERNHEEARNVIALEPHLRGQNLLGAL